MGTHKDASMMKMSIDFLLSDPSHNVVELSEQQVLRSEQKKQRTLLRQRLLAKQEQRQQGVPKEKKHVRTRKVFLSGYREKWKIDRGSNICDYTSY